MKIFFAVFKTNRKKVGHNYNYRATFLPFSQPHFFQNLRPLQTADYTHKTQPTLNHTQPHINHLTNPNPHPISNIISTQNHHTTSLFPSILKSLSKR